MIKFFTDILLGFFQAAIRMALALVEGLFTAPFRAAAGEQALRCRRATAEEVRPLRHRVLREGRPFEDAVWAGDDHPDTRHYAALLGDAIVGVATVMPAPFPEGGEPSWQLRGMAVDPTRRGLGTGSQLLAFLEEDQARDLWCNARVTAAGFYQKNGWRRVGDPFDIPGVGEHFRMVRRR